MNQIVKIKPQQGKTDYELSLEAHDLIETGKETNDESYFNQALALIIPRVHKQWNTPQGPCTTLLCQIIKAALYTDDINLAWRYIQKNLELNPNEEHILAQTGQFYLKQGNKKEAKKYLAKLRSPEVSATASVIKALTRQYNVIVSMEAKYLITNEQYTEALKLLQPRIHETWNEPEGPDKKLLSQATKVASCLGNYPLATLYIEKGLAHNPDDKHLVGQAVIIFASQDNPKKDLPRAKEYLNRHKKMNPNTHVHGGLTDLYKRSIEAQAEKEAKEQQSTIAPPKPDLAFVPIVQPLTPTDYS